MRVEWLEVLVLVDIAIVSKISSMWLRGVKALSIRSKIVQL